LAALGMPGLANFVGEILVLLGTFQVNRLLALLATLGFVLAAVYALWIVQRIFAGSKPKTMPAIPDIHGRELALMTVLLAIIFWLGIHPQPVLNTTAPSIRNLQQIVNQTYQDEQPVAASYDQTFLVYHGEDAANTLLANANAALLQCCSAQASGPPSSAMTTDGEQAAAIVQTHEVSYEHH